MKITVTEEHLHEGDVLTTSSHPLCLAVAEACGRSVLGLSTKRSGKGNTVGRELSLSCNFIFFSWNEPCLPLHAHAKEFFRALRSGAKPELPFVFDLIGLEILIHV